MAANLISSQTIWKNKSSIGLVLREWKAFIPDPQFIGLSRKFKEDFRFQKRVCMLEDQPQSGTYKASQQNGKGSGEGHAAVRG